GGISIRDALRIREAASLVTDIVGTTNERAAAMIFPVTQLMRDRKAPPLPNPAGIDGDDRSITVADYTSLAAIELRKPDLCTRVPGDGLDINVLRGVNA